MTDEMGTRPSHAGALSMLRALLVLGRVSNLPTVWSNLIVGWLLLDGPRSGLMRVGYNGPDATPHLFFLVLLGGSFLYVGGMYLNDYCDAGFDARYCPQRPIPSGRISRRIVGLLAVLWFAVGFACFTSFGPLTLGVGLVLVGTIILYDFHHKDVAWAPSLMGFCRCLLYILGASAVQESYWYNALDDNWWSLPLGELAGGFADNASMVLPRVLLLGIALGLYVTGITYVARGESRPGKATRWPYLLLLLAVMVPFGNTVELAWEWHWPFDQYTLGRLLQVLWYTMALGFLLIGWMAWLLIPLWRKTKSSIGRVVSGLLAGIVLFDLIVLVTIPWVGISGAVLICYSLLFLSALLLQRIIPAT